MRCRVCKTKRRRRSSLDLQDNTFVYYLLCLSNFFVVARTVNSWTNKAQTPGNGSKLPGPVYPKVDISF
jgi:hypothetical protein